MPPDAGHWRIFLLRDTQKHKHIFHNLVCVNINGMCMCYTFLFLVVQLS